MQPRIVLTEGGIYVTREEYCRLIRRGIINQRSAVLGFRALALRAPNADVRDTMLLLAHQAHHNRRLLMRQLARYCNGTTIL